MASDQKPEQGWCYDPSLIGYASTLSDARSKGLEVLYVAHLCTEGDRTALVLHHGQWEVTAARGFLLVVKRDGETWTGDSLRLNWKS